MSAPPRLAVWLVSHLASRYSRDSLIGDLLEEYSHGRLRRWYWKQVAIAIGLAASNALNAARWLALSVVLLRAMAAVLPLTALVSFARHSQHPAICSVVVPPVLLVTVALGTATLTWAGTTAPVSPMPSAATCRSVQ